MSKRTGCTKKVTCVVTRTEPDDKIRTKLVATIKKGKVDSVSAKLTFTKKTVAKEYCNYFGLIDKIEDGNNKVNVKCSDTYIVLKNYSNAVSEEDYIGLSKSDFVNKMTNNGMECN